MNQDQENGLFAGLADVVDQALGVSDYTTKRSALDLSRHGLGPRAATLVPALFDRLDRNWALALEKPSMSVVRQFETDQAFREERLWLIRVRV